MENFLKIRDNGVKAIEDLMKKRGRFDYILLETTGLADPGLFHNSCIYYLYRIQSSTERVCMHTPFHEN
jgi:G3E family GTPase